MTQPGRSSARPPAFANGRAAALRLLASPLWIAGPALGFLLPSPRSHMNAFRILAVGVGLAALILFTGRYYVPGGASHFALWAQALADGTTLPAAIAQRDIGFPLLLLLGGYTITGSFLGITLIHAIFAAAMPVLVYAALRPFSLAVAYYAGQTANLCLGSFVFVKMIHHDQAYIFFMILSIVLLIRFFASDGWKYLYFFMVACVAASVCRPAGNLLVPLFLVVAFLFARRPRRVVHCVLCAAIFAAATAAYHWHRYEIFDMRNQPAMPSYTGEQVFYNPYMNSAEFGIRLGPELGPNMRALDEALREKLTETPRESRFLLDHAAIVPPAFAEAQFLPFDRDQLMRRVYLLPNWEYYTLLCDAMPDDQTMLRAAGEIAKAYPLYVLRYSLRNLIVFLFRPGYSHPRADIEPFRPIGLEYYPESGVVSETWDIADRAVGEARFDLLPALPWLPRAVLSRLKFAANYAWDRYYARFVDATNVLMLVAWLALGWAGVCAIARRLRRDSACGAMLSWRAPGFTAAALSASMLLLYNAAVTAAFVEPDYRYSDFLLLVRVLVAAFGVIVVLRLAATAIAAGAASSLVRRAASFCVDGTRRFARAAQARDPLEIALAGHPAAAAAVSVTAAAAVGAGWVATMHAYVG